MAMWKFTPEPHSIPCPFYSLWVYIMERTGRASSNMAMVVSCITNLVLENLCTRFTTSIIELQENVRRSSDIRTIGGKILNFD